MINIQESIIKSLILVNRCLIDQPWTLTMTYTSIIPIISYLGSLFCDNIQVSISKSLILVNHGLIGQPFTLTMTYTLIIPIIS